VENRKNKTIYFAVLLIFAIILNISCKKDAYKDLKIYGEGVTDIDGNSYGSVIIGNQEWMFGNLKTTTYNDGTDIPTFTDKNDWSELSIGAYVWYENNFEEYGTYYGVLYNWYAVNTLKLCPAGWRVPTTEDWTILSDYLGGVNVTGGKLKSGKGWNENGNGTDDYGFNALPAGQRRGDNGNFIDNGLYAYWWSSSVNSGFNPIGRWIPYGDNGIGGDIVGGDKRQGFSIRCIKDTE
jgi:uncharacterized protein (TIGR02145 family)